MENEEVIERGTHVRVNSDIRTTDRRYSSCSDMHNMKGKVYRVNDVLEEGRALHISGFTFATSDVTVLNPEKESQPFHFTVEALAI